MFKLIRDIREFNSLEELDFPVEQDELDILKAADDMKNALVEKLLVSAAMNFLTKLTDQCWV